MWVRLLDADGELVTEAGLTSREQAFRYALGLLMEADMRQGGCIEWDGEDE